MTTQILGRALRNMTCVAEGQESSSPRGQTAALNRVRPVVHEKSDRRVLRVLVYDHDPDTADVMARQVRRWGHTAIWASDGAVAVTPP